MREGNECLTSSSLKICLSCTYQGGAFRERVLKGILDADDAQIKRTHSKLIALSKLRTFVIGENVVVN